MLVPRVFLEKMYKRRNESLQKCLSGFIRSNCGYRLNHLALLALEMGTGKVFEDPDHLGMIIFAVLLCLMVNPSMNIMTWQKLSQSLSRCRYIFRRASKGTRGALKYMGSLMIQLLNVPQSDWL